MVTLIDQTRELWEKDDLPDGLAWISDLRPHHQRLFYAELQYQWSRYCATQDDAALVEFLEDWKATAEVDHDPELSAYLLAPKDESEFEEWNPATPRDTPSS